MQTGIDGTGAPPYTPLRDCRRGNLRGVTMSAQGYLIFIAAWLVIVLIHGFLRARRAD
jgi:hypothetical protein